MRWAERHRLWHVLGVLVVIVVVAMLAFCGESPPLGVHELTVDETTDAQPGLAPAVTASAPVLDVSPKEPHTRRRATAGPYHPAVRTRSVAERLSRRPRHGGLDSERVVKDLAGVRDLELPVADRMAALDRLEMRGFLEGRKEAAPTPAELDALGLTLRTWRARRTYRRLALGVHEVRAVVLDAISSRSASVRAKAVERLDDHHFTVSELSPALGRAIRSDAHDVWFIAERVLDRLTLSARDADDLIVDWESAFADGGTKRRRFLVGLGARLRPRPPGLTAFLVAALRDVDRDVRASAVNALGRLGLDGSNVGDAIIHASSDPDDRVAQLATEWIGILRK